MSFERFLIPPYLLRHLADAPSETVSEHAKDLARRALDHFERVAAVQVAEFERHGISAFLANGPSSKPPKDSEPEEGKNKNDSEAKREVYDMEGSQNEMELPGKLVRDETTDPSDSEDKAVNNVFDNVGRVLAMLKDKFGWTGVDDESDTAIVSSVHFGEEYENACESTACFLVLALSSPASPPRSPCQ